MVEMLPVGLSKIRGVFSVSMNVSMNMSMDVRMMNVWLGMTRGHCGLG